jgi:hypothetical protein
MIQSYQIVPTCSGRLCGINGIVVTIHDDSIIANVDPSEGKSQKQEKHGQNDSEDNTDPKNLPSILHMKSKFKFLYLNYGYLLINKI